MLGVWNIGASTYALRSLLNNEPAVAIPFRSGRVRTRWRRRKQVREDEARLKTQFPEGLDYKIVYDPTVFVRQSIEAVGHTFVEALILVVLVC